MKKKTASNSLKECTLYVDGMHCPSCEVLIEKKLLKENGVESVDASLSDSTVKVMYSGNKPDVNKINPEFEELGYQFDYKKFKKNTAPLFSVQNGSIKINQNKLKGFIPSLGIAAGILLLLIIFEKLQLGRYVSVDANSSLPAFFGLGIVAGTSSCAALVGGILLSMSKQWNEVFLASENPNEKAKPHILFHAGRLLSFALFGGVLGVIGSAISLDNVTVYSVLIILISLIMLVLALQMLGVEWAQKFRIATPKFLTRYVADESNFTGKYMPFIIGASTFLLPCGFTLIAQGVALASGSFVRGALVMSLFALGTFIPLSFISFSGVKFNSKPHLSAKFNQVAGILIMFFVVYNINAQLNVLGLPSLSDIKLPKEEIADVVNTTSDTENNEQQVITVTADGFSYTPTSSTTIKAGVPTKLIVTDEGMQGCGKYMAARGLFDGYVALKSGENVVEFTPQKGTYKLTCTMGMVPPVTISVI